MNGKTILITGSTDGIGKQAALDLARMGARVLVHGRSEERGRRAVAEIKAATGAEPDLFIADLSSQAQVRDLAAQVQARYDRLDVLVNNAGVVLPRRNLTEDGIEETFAVNHLAPFLLTHLLLDLLKRSAPARVVIVSSGMHRSARVDWDNLQGERRYDSIGAYSLSKLGNVVFTLELARRLAGSGVTVNSLEPGSIGTKLLRAGWGGGGQPVEVGAQKVVYLAVSPEVEGVSGQHFQNNRPIPVAPLAQDEEVRRRLWEISAQLTGVD
jgi:NAD(P)-dependent dehydrogenase (short-subunit alcohol dehydrogenase family)